MKFKITFVALMVACLVSIYSIINAISGGINENQAGLNRLNKSFLSLSKEFEEVKRKTGLDQQTKESYRNSLVDLADRVGDMEETNSEIYHILKELDEQLNAEPIVETEPVENLGVNAGLGVLTGTHVLKQPEIQPEIEIQQEVEVIIEPVILSVCPKVSSPHPYGNYIKNISIKRNLKFTVIYDMFEGNITNIQYDGRVPGKIKTATTNYIMDLTVTNPATIRGCSIPFTINI
jgi:ElaB/YqjD/DUF883 family membrane-anchored ribosome-binding protein